MAFFTKCRLGIAVSVAMLMLLSMVGAVSAQTQVRGSIKEGERREVYNGKFPRPFNICSNKRKGDMILTHDGEKTVLAPGQCVSFEAKKLTVYSQPDRTPKSQPKRKCFDKYTYSSGRGSGGLGRVHRSQQCN